MAFVDDYVLDAALSKFSSEGDRIDICSSLPATYAEATSTYTLGNKTSVTIGSPADAAPNGRKVVVPPISGGNVTGTGTAGFYAISDSSGGGQLLAAGPLSASQVVTSGNEFSLASFEIKIPDAT